MVKNLPKGLLFIANYVDVSEQVEIPLGQIFMCTFKSARKPVGKFKLKPANKARGTNPRFIYSRNYRYIYTENSPSFHKMKNAPTSGIEIKGIRYKEEKESKINEREDSVASILNYLDGERGGPSSGQDRKKER